MAKVYLDTNVEQHATPEQFITVHRTIQWGDRRFTAPILTTRKKAEPKSDFLRREIPHLARIAMLARQGYLSLHSSLAARLETVASKTTYLLGNPFAGVHIEQVVFPWDSVVAGVGLPEFPFLDTKHDSRFNKLKRIVGGGRSMDAFLLRCAEAAGMDYFLTLDERLLKAVRNQGRVRLACEVVMPSELLDRLTLRGLDLEADGI